MKTVLSGLFALSLCAQTASLTALNHNAPVLDAHNCYPYEGQWSDRIQRALSAGFPVAIEQDLAWYVDPATGRGRVVVSHTPNTTGTEPELRQYFFETVRPAVEQALKTNDRPRWPLIVLHFDFKDNQPALLHAVWNLLGEFEPWLTTAPKGRDANRLEAFDVKPILAITEDSDAQEEVFFRQVPATGRLRLFGSAHTVTPAGNTAAERAHRLVTAAPADLLNSPPTNYRRWWNNSWYAVEEGGAPGAGEWTAADDERLRSLVDHAHKLGYWIRFYTLDGFAPENDKGWGTSYNFGSAAAARLRWQAAIAAGVNLIATDQYEDLGALLHAR